MLTKKDLQLFFLCLTVCFSFVGCNKSNFALITEPPPANKPSSYIDDLIKKLSPSFVTRGPGCIMCHADIKGGFFLDFGYDGPSESNKLFLGGANDILPLRNGKMPESIFYNIADDPNDPTAARVSLGRNRYFTWFRDADEPGWMAFTDAMDSSTKSKVRGILYVPDVTLSKEQYPELFSTYINSAQKKNASSITLADLISTPLQVPSELNMKKKKSDTRAIATPVKLGNPMSAIITPDKAGAPAVVALKELKIGAPTSADIKNLIAGQTCPAGGCLIVKGSHATVGGFKGIDKIDRLNLSSPSMQNGCASSEKPASNAYSNIVDTRGATSVAQVVCSGDVVVVGSLFLKNLNIKTDAAGCRFYVDGNVWIDGSEVTYADDATGNAHLQITATNGIMFGLYNSPLANPNNANDPKEGQLLRRMSPDDDKVSTIVLRSTVMSDNPDINLEASKKFVKSILCDGTYAPNNFFTNPPEQPGIKNIKKAILNAPFIQGYFRKTTDLVADPRLMTGIIISETSVFGGNNFSFKFSYDTVFSTNSDFSFFPAFGDDVKNKIFYAVEK